MLCQLLGLYLFSWKAETKLRGKVVQRYFIPGFITFFLNLFVVWGRYRRLSDAGETKGSEGWVQRNLSKTLIYYEYVIFSVVCFF